MQQDKAALRRALRARRRARDAARTGAERLARADAFAHRVISLPEVRGARTVAAYVSVGAEPPTDVLRARLREAGVRVLLPVVLPDLDLDWAVDDGDLAPGVGPGVPEPTGARLGRDAIGQADVVVVPALAADAAGRRLGQGGGSYDRALPRRSPAALVVALVDDEDVLDEVLVEVHDMGVDVVLTGSRVLRSPA